MSFLDELALEILREDAFWEDYQTIQKANIALELNPAEKIVVHDDTIARALQCAMTFAGCESPKPRGLAQRISTAVLRVTQGQGAQIPDIFVYIQGRLRNFPALSEHAPPASGPLSLQMEFIEAREEQTVKVLPDRSEIFTRFQLAGWKALSGDKSVALTAPTSAGKSYVILLHVISALKAAGTLNVVYLVPTRALINQVADDFFAQFDRLGISDVLISTVPVSLGEDANKVLYVFTQERLDVLLEKNIDLHIDLVVVDEAQSIGAEERGVLLESVIDKVRRNNVDARFVFSGPLITNPEFFRVVLGVDEFPVKSADESPVTQNLIKLDYRATPTSEVAIRQHEEGGDSPEIARLPVPIRLLTDADRLSYLSAMFGKTGSTIVYSAGKADAEKIAVKLSELLPEDASPSDDGVAELIGFSKKHVHKDYVLAETLKHGVAFHYGNMPSLLRKEIERSFRERRIPFIVCTSTLLYGLNLPARNIFLHKPKTGRETPIAAPDFWNLAGRAGRLGKETQGNVYLIDYDSWDSKPLGQEGSITVTSALKQSLVEDGDDFLAFLDAPETSSGLKPGYEIVLGKLVADYRKGFFDETISRYAAEAPQSVDKIRGHVTRISDTIDIPTDTLSKNAGVSIFRQKDLLTYFEKRLKQLEPMELIPSHPLGDFEAVRNNYTRVFKRIHTYILKYPSGDRRHHFFSGLALRWMRGDQLPILIENAIKWHTKNNSRKSKAAIIRETMENVESDLRFRYVKYMGCYNALLAVALSRTGCEEYVQSIPDLPLYLEMGGSSGAMISLMALGLSRTSAGELVDYVNDKDMDITAAKRWLAEQPIDALDLSAVCIREIKEFIGRGITRDSDE